MCAIWKNHAMNLASMINKKSETEAHLYLEQLMLFPVDIQDKIIEEISSLSQCNSDAVANIIGRYSIMDLK